MRWLVVSVLLLVSLVILERFVPVRGRVEEAFWPVEKYFFSIRGWTDSVGKCAISSGGVNKEKERILSVSEISLGEVLIKGKGEKGDLVIDKDGRILGIVQRSFGRWVIVETPLSEDFKMFVSVMNDKMEVEGNLIGGDPPLVRVPENLDLNGWKVFISKSVPLGGYIRGFGKGEIGRIIGRKGDFWMMDPTAVHRGLVIVGK